MWIHPAARGRGLARVLLSALEARATELGATHLYLDTNATLIEAAALYRGSGYREIEPYNDNPYASLWFAKQLLGRPS
jgi:GNAT superfamily N-acetyltransferase